MGWHQKGPDGLSNMERSICLAIDRGLNNREAYREAVPHSTASDRSARQIASRVRKRPRCVAFLRKLQAQANRRHSRSKDSILRELASLAFADSTAFLEPGADGAVLRDFRELTPEQRRQVQRIVVTKSRYGGTVRLDLCNKQAAFKLYCRVLGHLDSGGQKGGDTRDLAEIGAQMSDVERAQRLVAMLRLAKKADETDEQSERVGEGPESNSGETSARLR